VGGKSVTHDVVTDVNSTIDASIDEGVSNLFLLRDSSTPEDRVPKPDPSRYIVLQRDREGEREGEREREGNIYIYTYTHTHIHIHTRTNTHRERPEMDGVDLENRGSEGKDKEIMIQVSVDERACSQAEYTHSDTLSHTCNNILTHKRESKSEKIWNDTVTPGPGTGFASPRTSKSDELDSSQCRLPFRLEWRQRNRHPQSHVEQGGGCDRCVPDFDVGHAAVENGCRPVQGGQVMEMSCRQDGVKEVRGRGGEGRGREGRGGEREKAVGEDLIKTIS